MKMLWIGSFASDEMFIKMPVKTMGQASGVTSQRSLLSGFDKCLESTGIEMDSLNIQGLPAYPLYPEKNVKKEKWSRNGHSTDISIGFRNTRLCRLISQKYHLVMEAMEWLSTNKEHESIHIFIYEPVLSRLAVVKAIKKRHPDVKCHLIVPDIPEYVGRRDNKIYIILKQIRSILVKNMLRIVDDYVFYTKQMSEYYNVPPEHFMVMEGSIDAKDAALLVNEISVDSLPIKVLYCGAITRERDIPSFLDAFRAFSNQNVVLWFTGAGNFDADLRKISKIDQRIKHFGFLDTREEVLKMQSNATALLHIRDKFSISSRYCFPSKLFEYLASGKPVLSTRIPGIPDEYIPYLIEITELTPTGVASALDKVVSMSQKERDDFGAKAREFVLLNKNAIVQAQRMLNFAFRKQVNHND